MRKHLNLKPVTRLWLALAGAALLGLVLVAVPISVAHAANLCVKPGGGDGCYATIQEAVNAAQAGDTIAIAAGTYAEHDIALGKNLTLQGAGADTTIVDANQLGRAFTVNAGVTVVIRDLTIQNGKVQNDNGGAISNAGTLTLLNSTLKNNRVEGPGKGGGAIYSQGTLTVTGSTFDSNLHTGTVTAPIKPPLGKSADGQFGGGAILSTGTLTVQDSTFVGNNAAARELVSGDGGAIFNTGTLTVTRSTFDQNEAGCGGGVANASTATVTGSTFSRNRGQH
jgi:predicted outer membrane repeat protein